MNRVAQLESYGDPQGIPQAKGLSHQVVDQN
jgi:hypothetical protein